MINKRMKKVIKKLVLELISAGGIAVFWHFGFEGTAVFFIALSININYLYLVLINEKLK